MTPEARRDGIVEIVNRDGKASVEALADSLDASRETIRRDLTELDRQGLLRKVHGGATAAEPSGFEKAEGALAARMTQNLTRKRAIARKAAGLLKPGDSLFIDTGSTTLIFAEELPQIAGLTVITNSAAIAALAIKAEDSRVFLIGGEYRRGGQESVGDMAVRQIGEFRAAYAFLTVAAYGAGRKPIPGDGEPVMGELSAIPGYYVAFSHSGATLGLIVGELLAYEIATGARHPMLASFRPERFSA